MNKSKIIAAPLLVAAIFVFSGCTTLKNFIGIPINLQPEIAQVIFELDELRSNVDILESANAGGYDGALIDVIKNNSNGMSSLYDDMMNRREKIRPIDLQNFSAMGNMIAMASKELFRKNRDTLPLSSKMLLNNYNSEYYNLKKEVRDILDSPTDEKVENIIPKIVDMTNKYTQLIETALNSKEKSND